jgi:uncharacterized membrane protein YbhN (UPF0104 family)
VVAANGFYALLGLVLGGAAIARASASFGIGAATLPIAVALSVVGLFGSALGVRFAAQSARLADVVRRALVRIPSARSRAWLDARAGAFTAVDASLADVARTPLSTLFLAMLPVVASWLADPVETWFLLHLLGRPVAFGDVVAIDVIVSLLRSLTFIVPGGIGVQEAGYVGLLTASGTTEGAALALAVALLKRAKDIVWAIIGSALLVVRSPSGVIDDRARRGPDRVD